MMGRWMLGAVMVIASAAHADKLGPEIGDKGPPKAINAPAPPAAADADPLARLVRQLGDASFERRDEAARELARRGADALPALRIAASDDTDPEVQVRAAALIEQIEKARQNATAEGAARNAPPVDRAPVADPDWMRIPDFRLRPPDVRLAPPRGDDMAEFHRDFRRHAEMALRMAGVPEADLRDLQRQFDLAERLTTGVAEGRADLRDVMMAADLLMQIANALEGDDDAGGNGARGAVLGVSAEPADQALVAQLGPGVVVRDVVPGSRAAQMGVRPHDLIRRVNGQAVSDVPSLREALQAADRFKIELVRRGQRLTLEEK